MRYVMNYLRDWHTVVTYAFLDATFFFTVVIFRSGSKTAARDGESMK